MRFNAAFIGLAVAGFAVSAQAAEVNVYSARQDHLLKPLVDRFTEETGIAVNILSGKAEQLLERLKAEGESSPADVLITVDAGNLYAAKQAGVLQPVTSDVLAQNIPAQYRDSEGEWYGLSLRARPIFYSKDRVDPADLSTYEDLASEKWNDRICIRSSSNIYNQSLLAAMIATEGEEKATDWAKGIVENMARKPQGGDRDQIMAVAAGECDVAIANTYYYAGMLTGDDAAQKDAAQKIGVFFPNQDGRGTHVNVSGAGVVAGADNKEEAVKLLEFLSSEAAQQIYAEVNGEYPVKPGVQVAPVIQAWGEFKSDDLKVEALGENNAEAVKIFDRVGWR